MAGDWIKMRVNLFTHPKVVRMASALKVDNLRTVGGLMSVWCLFDEHSEDGRLDGYALETIDAHLRWEGFAEAMKAVGWIDDSDPEGLCLPRFDSHNGQSAKRRAQDADRKREDRKTSASEADKKRTREEKRRGIQPSSPAGARGREDGRFAMTVDWRPSEHFPALAHQSGVISPEGGELDAAVAEFVSFWLSRDDTQRTQHEWDHALLRALKSEKARPSGSPAQQRQRRAAEPAWRADQRRRTQEAVPGIAERSPSDPLTIDVEARDATPPALG